MTTQFDQEGREVGWLLAVMVAAGLTVFDPFGWDHFGPVRWFVIPTLGAWAVARSVGTGPLIDRTTITKLWAGLLGWGAVTAVLGPDKLHAWIGTPDRRFGLLTWLLCAVLFLVARRLGDQQRRLVVRGFAVGALGLGLYALFEWLGVTFGSGPLWPTISVEFAGARIGGPFGQPAFLGAAAVLAGPVAFGLAADPNESSRWRIVGGVGAATTGLAVLTSQSRAAWIGLIVAVIVAAAVSAIRTRGASNPGRSRLVQSVTGACAVLVLAVLVTPTLRRRVTGAFGSDGVVTGRLDEWQVGLRALGDAPILGYGPEGYRTVFGRHVDEQYVLRWGWEVITDRAHNGILDTALAFGVPGALLFLALLVLAIRAAVRAIGSTDPIDVGLGVGVIAYLAQQQFLFPISEIDPLLWTAVGLLPALAAMPQTTGGRGFGRSIAVGAGLGAALVVTAAGLLDLAANLRLGRATAEQGVSAEEIAEGAADAGALRPDSIRYLFIESRAAGGAAARVDGGGGDLVLALERIEEGLVISPEDPALLGEEGRLLLEIARAAPPGQSRDQAIDRARTALEALGISHPNHPEHLQRLGIVRALDGDVTAGIEAMERAVALAPDRPEPQQNLDELLRLADDP